MNKIKLIFTLIIFFSSLCIADVDQNKVKDELPSLKDITTLHVSITDFYPPNELQFVDKDIRQAFMNTQYAIGMPTNIQLIRELRKLNAHLKRLKQ